MNSKVLEKSLDVANKTTDLANKVYDDGLSKPTKTIGNGLSMCLSFLRSMVSPVMYKYIQNAEYKKKEIDKKLSEKYNLIPEDKRATPRMNILGPAVELLKYNLNEDHIKEIFINIMSSEMNSEKQNMVLPSYVEIVKQLSKKDALTLKSLNYLQKTKNSSQFVLDIIRAKPCNGGMGYYDIDKYIIDKVEKNGNAGSIHTIKLDPLVIDNLCRLELIKIYEGTYILDTDEYEMGFNYIKNNYDKLENYVVYYEKGLFELTSYGINFIKICFE